MSRVSCHVCGKNNDSRAMQVCPGCSNYVCDDCYRDHPQRVRGINRKACAFHWRNNKC